MRALLVVAHPLDNVFAKAAAERIRVMLERRGIEVDMIDLYGDDSIRVLPAPSVAAISRRPMIARPSPVFSGDEPQKNLVLAEFVYHDGV